MITSETIAKACESGHRRLKAKVGWFSNGYFAVKGWTELGEEDRPGLDESVPKWIEMKVEPVLEAVELRIDRSVGWSDCVCDCGHEHQSEHCDDYGQRVYSNGRGQTVVDPRLGELLVGLTVMRQLDETPELAQLLGYDNGELVCAVMPMREKVRSTVAK